MKKRIISFVLSAIWVTIISCHQKRQQPKNIIVPVDFSISRDSTVIAWYKTVIVHSVLKKAGKADRIIILPVDSHSELWGQEIFRIDFGMFKYDNEYAGLQKDEIGQKNFLDTVSSAIKRFSENFDATITQRKAAANGTDIIGALKQCQKYLSADHENIIVLLSDMQQSTKGGELNLEAKNLSTSMVEAAVGKTEKISLATSKVIVLTGPELNTSLTRFSIVKAFWENYFIKCDAKLVDYSSGAVAKLEELLTKTK